MVAGWGAGEKYPGIRSAPGTPGVPGKAWRLCGQGRVRERERDRQRELVIGNEVFHRTICQRVPGSPQSGRTTEPTVQFHFLEVQTVIMNCKGMVLSIYSLLIKLHLTPYKNWYLLLSLLDPFTHAFLPPETPFLTPLPVQSLPYFKT